MRFGWVVLVGALVLTACSSGSVEVQDPTEELLAGFAAGPLSEVSVEDAVEIGVDDDISEIIDDHPPGTTFAFRPGVHSRVSFQPRSGDVIVGMPGSVLDGEYEEIFAVFAHDLDDPVVGVTVRNLVVEHYATPAEQGTVGGGGAVDWLIESNEIRYSTGAGVSGASGMTVRQNYIHHHEQIGIVVGVPAVGMTVEGNEISENNHTKRYEMSWEAGGAKFIRTIDLVVRGNYVHDNQGAGLWTDGENTNVLYEDNIVLDNAGPGIHHEISYDAVIRDNVVLRNAHDYYVGGILIAGSENVEVYGNTLIDNDGGIIALQEDRGSGSRGRYDIDNLSVYENNISYDSGFTGALDQIGDGTIFDSNVSFADNIYDVEPDQQAFSWGGDEQDIDGWLALGFG